MHFQVIFIVSVAIDLLSSMNSDTHKYLLCLHDSIHRSFKTLTTCVFNLHNYGDSVYIYIDLHHHLKMLTMGVFNHS